MFLSESEVTEVLSDDITIAEIGNSINQEARSNLWTFSLRSRQEAVPTVEDVTLFLHRVINAREQQLLHRFGRTRTMVFYNWFDEQAAQLRFSLVSKSFGYLPFTCRLNSVESFTIIVEQFLTFPHHRGIPVAELDLVSVADMTPEELDAAMNQPSREYILDLWSIELPRPVVY